MRKKLHLTIIIFHFMGFGSLFAQNLPDFTDLSSPNTICNYGNTSNPFSYTGIAINRHTLITQQGTDPNTGFLLPFLPAGENAVIRLGNSQVGAEAEAVTYRFTVNPDFSLLELKFAVVFQDPGHIQVAQPRFVVKVINAMGQLLEQCTEYDVSASGNVPGFNSYTGSGLPVRWRPWTSVGIDLSQYIGQEIRVQFITYDCSQSGHYGYAYYTAHCVDNQLELTACDGDSVTLSAPTGFSSYSWSNGATTPSTTYQVSNGSLSANCLITSVTGCQFTLNAYLSSFPDMPSQDTIYHSSICQGDPFTEHFFDLPPQHTPGTFVFLNHFYNLNNCEGDITAILYLTVLQTQYHINASACAGTNYTSFGFQLYNLLPGVYYDTLFYTGSTGCDSNLCLQLIVNPSFQLPNVILGNPTPCQGEVENYSLQGADGSTNYNWIIPDGFVLMGGQGTPSIVLGVGSTATQGDLVLEGSNGCGSGTVTLTLTPNPSYHPFYTDSICTGNSYSQYGFQIPIQNSTGYFTFTQHFQTAEGCDSIINLALLVTQTPTLSIFSNPDVICQGTSVQLHAMGSGASIISYPQLVSVGDILCTDSTFVKPSNWPVPGKTAYGVVFYVDSTGQHGWAVHLSDQSLGVAWGSSNADIPTLPNISNYTTGMTNFDGYNNTLRIREYGSASVYPAAWAVDFVNGWYLPSMWQMRILLQSTMWINPILQIVGGTELPTHLNGGSSSIWKYWCSSENSDKWAWGASVGSHLYPFLKTSSFRVRAARNF
ncbi:MAG TPA: hypothetical protein PLI77_06165 [Bacteroidales bacterium]|nr:hypothetical protein [Bacteroidales bacterium]